MTDAPKPVYCHRCGEALTRKTRLNEYGGPTHVLCHVLIGPGQCPCSGEGGRGLTLHQLLADREIQERRSAESPRG